MRYFLSNGVRYPEFESDLFSQHSLRIQRIVSAGLLAFLLCFYILAAFHTADLPAVIYETVLFFLLIALLTRGIDNARKDAMITFRFHEGFAQNITYRGLFSVNTQAPHFISHITLFYRTRGGDVIRPYYVFSREPISKQLGDRTGDSFHEFNRQGMVLLPQTEELSEWIQERYQPDSVPEFPDTFYSAPIPPNAPEFEDM
jgi:hypothetical protein